MLFSRIIRPHKQKNRELERREQTFYILLLGFFIIVTIAFLISTIRYLLGGHTAHNIHPGYILAIAAYLAGLYIGGRVAYSSFYPFIFICTCCVIVGHSFILYGTSAAQGLAVFILVIVMSCYLLTGKLRLLAIILLFGAYFGIFILEKVNYINPDTAPLSEETSIANLVLFLIISLVIFLIITMHSNQLEEMLGSLTKTKLALSHERDRLERKVYERTRDLSRLQLEKNKQIYRYAEFGRLNANLLHDIANPLTSISLSMGELEAVQKSNAVNTIKEGLFNIEQQIKSARRQLSREKSSQKLNINEEIEAVLSVVAPQLRANKVRVRISHKQKLTLFGDSVMFSQILMNLISNSIDSLAKIDRIRLIEISISQENNSAILIVEDSGVGIDEKSVERIFEPFYTSKGYDTGTGIGLTITRQLVEDEFRGTIHVDETCSTGARFILKLPIT